MRDKHFTDLWFAHWDARRFSLATDSGFDWLAEAKRLMPKKYGKKNKGHEFYFLAISAFRSHDYQTATFLFDAALSEDLARSRDSRGSPAYLFMTLDNQNHHQAAKLIVEEVVTKLTEVIKSYVSRKASVALSLPEVRDNFLKYLAEHSDSQIRALTTTFITFLREWDYRSRMLHLVSGAGSREAFYTHLFRGCLLFESILKMEPAGKINKRVALDKILGDSILQRRLHLPKLNELGCTFDDLIRSLTPNQGVLAAIESTWTARNRLGHNLTLEAHPFDGEKYGCLRTTLQRRVCTRLPVCISPKLESTLLTHAAC
jgi:hypothetical protein